MSSSSPPSASNEQSGPTFLGTVSLITMGVFLLSFVLAAVFWFIRNLIERCTKYGQEDRRYQLNYELYAANPKTTPRPSPPASTIGLIILFLVENFMVLWVFQNVILWMSFFMGFEMSNLYTIHKGGVYAVFALFIFIAVVLAVLSTLHACRARIVITSQEIQHHNKENDPMKEPTSNYQSMDNASFVARVANFFKLYAMSIFLGLKTKWIFFLITLAFVLFLSIGQLLFLFGMCVCSQPYAFTSTFTRLSEPHSCPKNQVCFVMANLAEYSSSEMIIKYHSHSEPTRAYLRYDTAPGSAKLQRLNCTITDMNQYILDYEKRYVQTCFMTNLQPNTTYFVDACIEVYDAQWNSTLGANAKQICHEERKFTTLHNDMNSNVTFAAGGDWAVYEEGDKIFQTVGKMNPAFLLIGGDIVYDNGFPSCFRRWDRFFIEYDKYCKKTDGSMIPLLTAVGNHEAFYSRFKMKNYHAPNFLHFNTHSLNWTLDLNRPTYSVHQVAPHTSLMVLDSNVLTKHADQVNFIDNTFAQQPHKNTPNKVVCYHSPLYPSSRDFKYENTVHGRFYWEPLFNKHNVSTCLENHDHTFKRTHLINNGARVTSNGIVYIGDGALGVEVRDPDNNNPDRWWLLKAESKTHVWKMTAVAPVQGGGIRGEAYDAENHKFDDFYNKRV